MLMVLTGSLSSIPKPHRLLQRDLQWIHLPYLASLVLTRLSLMNPLMQTINYLRIRMVKCLPGILVLTAGMATYEEVDEQDPMEGWLNMTPCGWLIEQ